MQVARRAELMRLSTAAGASAAQNEGGAGDQMGAYRDLQASADMALRLLEGYLLSVRVRDPAAGALRLEPLCLASALYDAQQDLMLSAASYGVRLELALKPPSVPVLADKQALHAALVCLGYDLIAGLPAAAAATGGRQRLSLRLAGRHARHGQEVGMYGCLDGLSAETFRRARALHGRARQPLISALPGSGAGVFVADALLRAMSSPARQPVS
jgi:hypothetical protein